ncbi:MAG: isoprenylcysteine carboxylmethyltransferase family protein [Alphaproteobacteria bacterium]|nr:isoprenylcysteine carboxylmethyltransferase family protein [Alphaproteobacteria bacterium]
MGAIALIYSIVVYLIFFASFLYLIAFMGGDMTSFIGAPKTLDSGTAILTAWPAVLVNIGLLLLFGVQHSVMARSGFKKALTKIVPQAMERSTYVLTTVVVLVLLFVFWQPLPSTVWSVTSPLWSVVLMAVFFLGVGLVLLSTFMINHFELFGLLQGWLGFRKKEAAAPVFVMPYLYKYIRHPLYLGFLLAFWSTSHMTVGHLLFSSIWTAYIFVAIGYEERDLIAVFGDKYHAYMAKVPAILPFGRGK